MVVRYIGSDPLLQGKEFDLAGDAWNDARFRWLKSQNQNGKLIGLTETGEKHLLKIGDLEAPPINRGY